MSLPQLCPACWRGDHHRHDRYHSHRPGLIGGAYCPCPGGCEPPIPDLILKLIIPQRDK